MDIRRLVGQNVRRLRQAKGLSQEELAFASELHRTYISGVERGIRNPAVLIIARIAAALEQPTEMLLRAAPDQKPKSSGSPLSS